MEGIPKTADMHLPVLEIIEDGGMHKIGTVTDLIAERMGVTAEARRITTASGRVSFDVAVRRAVSNLRIAGLLENEELGIFKITGAGRDIAAQRLPSIDTQYLRDNCEPYRRYEGDRKKSHESIQRGEAEVDPREKRGIVAMIDVLGVRGSWREGDNGDIPELHKNWNKLLGSARSSLENDEILKREMTFTAFSDTMFITAGGSDHATLLLSFSRAIWRVITSGIMKDMPLRGCVSCGSYVHSGDNLFTGPAVDEAAEYYLLPQWIGISAAPSANGALNKVMPHLPYLDGNVYKRHDIPLKTSVEQDAWALNWPRQCEDDDKNEEGKMDEILERIDRKMESLTDIGAALKWRNTRKFCNDALLDDLRGRPWRPAA